MIARHLPTFLRYAGVGIATNFAGYMVYLALTASGLAPKFTMTVLYATGALLGFFGNRLWAFDHKGHLTGSLVRYLIAHGSGYLINYSMLFVLHDQMGYPHQLVQAAAVCVVACHLFVCFRFFVFPESTSTRERS